MSLYHISTRVHEPIQEESLLIEDMAQPSTLIVDALAASLAHILLAVCAIPIGVLLLTF